jgi:hypothetical protein
MLHQIKAPLERATRDPDTREPPAGARQRAGGKNTRRSAERGCGSGFCPTEARRAREDQASEVPSASTPPFAA